MYSVVVDYINSIFPEKNIAHFERAAYWVEVLANPASQALRIAAYGHDIERALRDEEGKRIIARGWLDETYLHCHQMRGAELLAAFLSHHGADKELIDEVKHLVSAHEVGGDEQQTILMNADSLSFLETNAYQFISEKLTIKNSDEVRKKLSWMYERIQGAQAKAIATPLYEKVLARLNTKIKELS